MGHVMYEVTLTRLILLSVEKAEMGLAVFYSHVMRVGKALPCFSWRSAVGRQDAADTDWNRDKILSKQ